MNYDQFQQWLAHHSAKYSGLTKWIGLLPAREKTLQAWYYAMRDVDLDHAKQASDRIFAGVEPEPHGWDRHPSTIRAIALRLADEARDEWRPAVVDGEQVYRCAVCLDQGYVSVWSPPAMDAARRGELRDFLKQKWKPRTVAVACKCTLGRSISAKCGVPGLTPVLLPAEMPTGCEKEQQRLIAHVERLRPVARGRVA